MFSRLAFFFAALLSYGQIQASEEFAIYRSTQYGIPFLVQEEASDYWFSRRESAFVPNVNARCWRYRYGLSNIEGYQDARVVNGQFVFNCDWPGPGGNTADVTSSIAAAYLCRGTLNERCELASQSRQTGKNAGLPDCEGIVRCGNPFDAGTGNKVQIEHDFEVPGSPLLGFNRFYNSAESAATGGALGRKWRHSFSYRLVTRFNGRIELQRPDGSVRYFIGTVPRDADENGTLALLLDANQTQTGWAYTQESGVAEYYDLAGRILRIEPREGGFAEFSYPGTSFLPSQVADNFGRTVLFSYSGAKLSTVTMPGGSVFSFSFDSSERLVSVTAPDSTTKQYIYDEGPHNPSAYLRHMLTGIVDETGSRFATFSYDKVGRVVVSEHAGGANRLTAGYGDAGANTVSNTAGGLRSFLFASVTGFERATEGRSQCPAGQSCQIGPAQATYDARGNLVEHINAAGVKTCRQFLASANLETLRVEGLAAATSCADALDDPSAYPQARTTTRVWDTTLRLPLQVAGPLYRLEYVYDVQGRVISQTVRWTTDTSGAAGLSASLTGLPRTTSFSYNPAGQVTLIDGPRTDIADVIEFAYDTAGNLVSTTNAQGQTTTLDNYDAAGRVGRIVWPNGRIETFSYDARGRLLAHNNEGLLTTLSWFPTGLLKDVTYPDGSTANLTYDLAHRLTGVEDAENTLVTFERDARGNVLDATMLDALNTQALRLRAVYDPLGRLVQSILGGI